MPSHHCRCPNLFHSQSKQLGLTGQWSKVKKAYAAANRLLGDIIKVTPSSKVTGDLAQFMVANDLTEEEVLEKAETLSFPKSVIEYFQGFLGIPPFGFPEPLRSRVMKGRTIEGYEGLTCFEGRPGADLKPFDFDAARAKLMEKWNFDGGVSDEDVLSHAMYPAVFDSCKCLRCILFQFFARKGMPSNPCFRYRHGIQARVW